MTKHNPLEQFVGKNIITRWVDEDNQTRYEKNCTIERIDTTFYEPSIMVFPSHCVLSWGDDSAIFWDIGTETLEEFDITWKNDVDTFKVLEDGWFSFEDDLYGTIEFKVEGEVG